MNQSLLPIFMALMNICLACLKTTRTVLFSRIEKPSIFHINSCKTLPNRDFQLQAEIFSEPEKKRKVGYFWGCSDNMWGIFTAYQTAISTTHLNMHTCIVMLLRQLQSYS